MDEFSQNFYGRGLGKDEVKFLIQGTEKTLSRSMVFRKLGAERTVRIPIEDYPETASPGEVVVHFGLPIPVDPPGTKVVLSKILRNGHFKSSGEEALPLLSFEEVWLATVKRCIEFVPYEALPKDCFKNALGGVKDVSSLKDLILARYRKSVPEFSKEQILSQGVPIRYLELTKKVSLS